MRHQFNPDAIVHALSQPPVRTYAPSVPIETSSTNASVPFQQPALRTTQAAIHIASHDAIDPRLQVPKYQILKSSAGHVAQRAGPSHLTHSPSRSPASEVVPPESTSGRDGSVRRTAETTPSSASQDKTVPSPPVIAKLTTASTGTTPSFIPNTQTESSLHLAKEDLPANVKATLSA
jgi:hypothetical protein